MPSIVSIYASSVRNNLKPLYANWEPGKPVKLGDYGYLEDDVFIYIGNIEDLGIKFSVRRDETPDTKTFMTRGSTEVRSYAKGSVDINNIVNVKAKLEINFSSDEAVFFNAAECIFDMIKDKTQLGKEILKKYHDGDWERSYVIVSDIVTSGSTSIAVSGGSSSSIVFEAAGDVQEIDLADAAIGINISSQKNVGYVIKAEKGLIPLIGLCKIQNKFLWWGDTFRPRKLLTENFKFVEKLEDKREIKTEDSIEDLFFGQLK